MDGLPFWVVLKERSQRIRPFRGSDRFARRKAGATEVGADDAVARALNHEMVATMKARGLWRRAFSRAWGLHFLSWKEGDTDSSPLPTPK